MDFSESIFINGITLTMIPLGPLRRPISWIGSFRHRRKLEKALSVIQPVVEHRLAQQASNAKPSSNSDALDWTIELASSSPKENTPRRIALHVLHNLWAGSAAPGGLVTQMVFQLLLEPKYLEPLVAETENAVSSYGYSDKALNSMPLLDSYIREINRLYPTGSGALETDNPVSLTYIADVPQVTCARTVMNKPFQFHDGLVLPVGSCIAIPAMAIQHDPANFPNPLVFDGFRFAIESSTRNSDAGEYAWSASTISTANLA